MKRYRVVIESSALDDLDRSYVWGCQQWGVAQARTWYAGVKEAIRALAKLPNRHPLAPESGEFAEEVRHLALGRYRVLYTIRPNAVHVLHLRGPFARRDMDADRMP